MGLDEIVQLEMDVDGSGTFSESETYVPLYDSSGHLAVLTATDGSVIEKYAYSPFGERWVMVDNTPPVVEQVRQEGGDLWIEVSEEALLGKIESAIASGALKLTRYTEDGLVEVALEASQPVTEGRSAGKRIVLHPTWDGEPESGEDDRPVAGEIVELYLEVGVLVDSFGNAEENGLNESFTWAVAAQTVSDTAAPTVERVCVTESGQLVVTFSEPVNTASSALFVNGVAAVWTADSTGYNLSTGPFGLGSYSFEVTTAPLDSANKGLVYPFSKIFSVVPGRREMVFDAPYPGVLRQSTVGNPYGFHGLRHELGTGLIFARNRYLDPEMGRFISADPLGYGDGPSLYQYGLNNTANFSDPMGLCVGPWEDISCGEFAQSFNPFGGGAARRTGWFAVGEVVGLAELPVDAANAVINYKETIQGISWVIGNFDQIDFGEMASQAFDNYVALRESVWVTIISDDERYRFIWSDSWS